MLGAHRVFLLSMSNEILLLIFSRVSVRDIINFCSISKDFQQIATQNEILWKNIYIQDFRGYPQPNVSSRLFDVYQRTYSVEKMIPYRKPCPVQKELEQQISYQAYQNLLSGVYSIKKTLPYVYWNHCAFDGEKLYIANPHSLITTMNIETGKESRAALENNGYFSSVATSHGKVYAGSLKHINIWDSKTGQCLGILDGSHMSEINFLSACANRLCSYAHHDKVLKVWDLDSKKCLYTLDEAYSFFPCVALSVDEGILCSSFSSPNIKIRDLQTGELLYTLDRHTGLVNCLLIFKGKLYSCSEDTTIKVWDPHTGKCLHTFAGHTAEVTSITIFAGRLCSCSKDQEIKFWSLETWECLQTLHQPCSTFLPIPNGKLYLGYHWSGGAICDFSAKNDVIFKEIACLLRTTNPEDSSEDSSSGTFSEEEVDFREEAIREASERFSKMPQSAQSGIQKELCSMLDPCSDEQEEFNPTPEQWAEAIERYLCRK